MPHERDCDGRRGSPRLSLRAWSTLRSIRRAGQPTVPLTGGCALSAQLVNQGGATVTSRGPGCSQGLLKSRSAGLRRLRLPVLAGMLGLLAVSLSGCSWSDAFALGWPRGITTEGDWNRQLWIGAVIASLVVGVHRLGLDVLVDCVPPQQGHRHRTAPPVRLQHAAGAGAHRDTVPDHLGAVLFHRGGAGEDAAPGVGSRGRRRRHLVPVELEVRLPEGRFQGRHAQVRRSRPGPQSGDGLQARGQRLPRRGTRRPGPRAQHRGPHLPQLRQGRDGRHQHRDPGTGVAGRQADRIPARVGGCGPRFLGAGVPVQA